MRKTITNLLLLPIVWIALIAFSAVLYALTYMPRIFSGDYYHFLSRVWCKLFVRALGVDLKLIHKNTRPLPKQYIVTANHPSVLEDFGLPALFDVYPLAKEGVRDWILLGRMSDYAGTIFVERDNPESRHNALQSLIDASNAGKNLVIFPEGGCKGRRIYKQFKHGAFEISLQTGVPIIPVYLQYIDEQAFEWQGQTLLEKLWQVFKANEKRVNYYVHDAIFPDKFSDKQSYAEFVHARYLEWQEVYTVK